MVRVHHLHALRPRLTGWHPPNRLALQSIICLNILNLATQGVWFDHPKSKYPGFCGIYGPMFANYTANSRHAVVYGVFQLLKTLLMVGIVGTTINSKIRDGETAPPTESTVQIWTLAGLLGLQLLFLVTQYPFNDHLENWVQMIVTVQQGMFFGLLGYSASFNDKPDGSWLSRPRSATASCRRITTGCATLRTVFACSALLRVSPARMQWIPFGSCLHGSLLCQRPCLKSALSF